VKIGLMIHSANDSECNKRPYDSIRTQARQAEADGFDSIWFADHLLYRDPGRPARGIWDCWTIMAALAEATERVEIGPLVLCNSFRQPAVLAKMATALDEVSDGRLVLGYGAGWHEPEYRAFGLPFNRKVDRLEEALQILRPLLRDGKVDFSGRYYQADDCVDSPRGPRPSGPPLMVGGEGPRMLRLTAQYADLWNTGYMGLPETMNEKISRIQAACREVGRDPATLGITALIGLWYPDLSDKKPELGSEPLTAKADELAAVMSGYAELGVEHIMFQCFPGTEETQRRLTEALRLYRPAKAA
jgi:probable F420-dependent oxidoreductase